MKKNKKILVLGVILLIIIVFGFLPSNLFENFKSSYYFKDESTPILNNGDNINLITPLNQTYVNAMSGYYPATYGFEDELDGTFGTDIRFVDMYDLSDPTEVKIIDELDGHKKILQLEEPGAGWEVVTNYFPNQTFGTIEFWARVEDATAHHPLPLRDDLNNVIYLEIQSDYFRWQDNLAVVHNVKPCLDNTWYHLRIDFRSDSTFDLYINGVKEVDNQKCTNPINKGINQIRFRDRDSTAVYYIDAIGYSWDPNYNIGDNLYKGILVSFTAQTTLNRMRYSLDNQKKISVFGNTTIPMPENGQHSIQIFGRHLNGTEYQSDIRYFTVDFPIDIITPETKTYSNAMSGYYPATYGFEDNPIGSRPSKLDSDVAKGISVQVIDEYKNHKNSIEFIDTNASASANILDSFAMAKTDGVVEFWICTNDSAEDLYIRIRGSISEIAVVIRTYGNMFQCYDSTSWSDLIPCTNDKWYHFSVEFNCSTDTFDCWINDTLIADDYGFRDGDLVDLHNFQIYTTNACKNLTYYVDAIGYSWDYGYNVGDNLNEGLLLSFENSTALEWAGYSLDGQTNNTIYGNKTIPLPKDGPHMIRVYGNNSMGIMYQSDIQRFSTHHINIVTPENKIYTNPMSDYYPGTYGFENDKDGTIPQEWSDFSGAHPITTEVIPEFNGHKKVIRVYDGGTGAWSLHNYFNITEGTVEFWWAISTIAADKVMQVGFLNASGLGAFGVGIIAGQIRVHTIGGWYNIPGLNTTANTWDHVRLDYRTNTGNLYEGLNQNEFTLYYNGVNHGTYGFDNNMDPEYIRLYSGYSQSGMYGYYDAIGYSWDPHYNIGDNWNEGLLLSYKNNTNLDWQGCSLDGKTPRSILGNTTIPMSDDGSHVIQVFGNDTLGNIYSSESRFFAINNGSFFDLVTPENKTYYAAMMGYYSATYGFDADEINLPPKGWISHVYGGTIRVHPEFDGHYKVIELSDTLADGNDLINHINEIQEGTIEFWMGTDNIVELNEIDICDDDDTNWGIQLSIQSSKFQYKKSDNLWYDIPHVGIPINNRLHHWKIVFNCSTYKFHVFIDGIDSGELNFKNNHNSFDRIQFHTSDAGSGFSMYIDAVGFSWDPNYNIGDNIYPGLHIGFTPNTDLMWLEYSIDDKINQTILGNTTIPFVDLSEGGHNIQLFGEDYRGILYKSEIRNFSIDYEIEFKTPEDQIYYGPMSGYYPGTYGFENEPTGAIDEDIAFIDWGPSSSIILDELDGHKKVIQIYRVGWAATHSNFTPTSEGKVEMWVRVDDSNADQVIIIGESDSSGPGMDRPMVHLTVESGNLYWASNATQHNLISAFSSDVWYHLRIDVFSNNFFDVYLNQSLVVSKEPTQYNMTYGMNSLFFKEYDGAARWYVDAVGYSWDPNYNIGDNINEGLLVSYENKTALDWQGYSLDGQPIKTILGNSTIQMPNDGEHLILVIGNDSLGDIYQSELRHFEVSSINIITPENKTYTERMSGYYPATYGFENDLDGDDPWEWDIIESGGTVQIIDSDLEHRKVVEIHETSDDFTGIFNMIGTRTNGTVEWWVKVNMDNDWFGLGVYSGDTTDGVHISFANDGMIRYNDGAIWNPIASYMVDTWYHFRIEWDCATDWHLWINGTSQDGGTGFAFRNSPANVDRVRLRTSNAGLHQDQYMFVDAVGYSWDPDYNIGDNLNEGLLLSFENTTSLNSQWYSLDGQASRTILGNTTFVMPSYGVHRIQIFGNDSFGNYYYSPIRHFTVQYFPIDIITPYNITYVDPMSGYYPATYGFENDHIGTTPDEWLSIIVDNQSGYTNINSEIGGHKNILECFHAINGSWHIRNYFSKTEGTIEFWVMHNSYNLNEMLDIIISNSSHTPIFSSTLRGGNYQVQTETGQITMGTYTINTWHHLRIDFRSKSGNSYLGLNQNEFNVYFDDIFQGTHTFLFSGDPFFIQFSSAWAINEYYSYFDAIGYSWDPNYNVGDNRNEGILLSYQSKYALDWQGFSLDSQPVNTILGNFTIPMPSDGVHTVQVVGNDTSGNIRYSSIRYFTVVSDINSPDISITLPGSNNLFAATPPFFDLTIVEPNLDTMWYTLDGGPMIITTEPTGHIDQDYWDSRPDGTVSIRFYANDTLGNEDYELVSVRKDTTPPDITINSPTHNQAFTRTSPSFDLTIVESNLDEIKYSLDNGLLVNITTGSESGQVEQLYWNAIPPGQYTLRFYVKDLVGHEVFADVIIRKIQPRISGYSFQIISLVSSVAMVYVIGKIKRKIK